MIQFRVGDEVKARDRKGRMRPARVVQIDVAHQSRIIHVEFLDTGERIAHYPAWVEAVKEDGHGLEPIA